MDRIDTSKEFEYRSRSGREKLSEVAQHEFDGYGKEARDRTAEEKENFGRFFERRVKVAEEDLLRRPELSKKGGPVLTIDGKPVQPPDVWKREDMTPQQQRDLRATAEEKVGADHKATLEEIGKTCEGKQRALLDRELGPRRFDRDLSHRDVGNGGRDGDDPGHEGPSAGSGNGTVDPLANEAVTPRYIAMVDGMTAEIDAAADAHALQELEARIAARAAEIAAEQNRNSGQDHDIGREG